MNRSVTAVLTFGCLLFVAGSCDQGGKKISLKFKYEPGIQLSYEQITKGTVKLVVGDSVIRDRQYEFNSHFDRQIKSILEDGTAEIIEIETGRYKYVSNLDSSQVDTLQKGYEYTLYMMPNGKPIFKDSCVGYMRRCAEQGMPVFPEGEHAQGYMWTQSTTVILRENPMEASTTFEIKSFSREQGYDCVVIAYDGNLVIPMKPTVVEGRNFLGGVDHVRASGHIYFAYKEGFVVLQRERWVVDGDRLYLEDPVDTVTGHAFLEYDIDFRLTNVRREETR